MTAAEFEAAGVVFGHRAGVPIARPPTPALRDALGAEVARRVPAFAAQLAAGHVAPQPLDRAPRARAGQCGTCGEPLAAHRGGDCPLCGAAWRAALRAAGVLA